MRTRKHYESMIEKNPGTTWGISLAAQAVYAATRGSYPGPNGSQGTDRELYRSIYLRLQGKYGEALDPEDVRREMAISAAQSALGSIRTEKKAAAVRANGKKGGRPKSRLTVLIEDASEILIFSGESETGSWKRYTGARSTQALKARVTKERCGGDRWVSVWISRGYNQADTDWQIYDEIDLATGDVTDTRDIDPNRII